MTQERHQQIIELINKNHVIKNKELMERFDISIETVRKDLKYLEQQGHLRRVYGGATLKEEVSESSASAELIPKCSIFDERAKKNPKEKNAIAREAANLVKKGETIFLEEGSTILAMTKYLKEIPSLTVITNSLRVAIALSTAPDCTVILPGGKLTPDLLTLVGIPGEESINNFNVDKAFIGVSGITETHFSDYSMDAGYIRRHFIKNSVQSIVLADHSKFGIRATVNICTIDALDIVITDNRTPDNYIRNMEKAGVQVIVADEDPCDSVQ